MTVERHPDQDAVDARWLELVAAEPRPCYVVLAPSSDLIPRIRALNPDVPVIADPSVPPPLGWLLAGDPQEWSEVRPRSWPPVEVEEASA